VFTSSKKLPFLNRLIAGLSRLFAVVPARILAESNDGQQKYSNGQILVSHLAAS
jgi:hypothetical protein